MQRSLSMCLFTAIAACTAAADEPRDQPATDAPMADDASRPDARPRSDSSVAVEPPRDSAATAADPVDAAGREVASDDLPPRPVDAGGARPDAARGNGLFVAVGSVGRTITSFDDGLSWTADRSDSAARSCTTTDCYEGNLTA